MRSILDQDKNTTATKAQDAKRDMCADITFQENM